MAGQKAEQFREALEGKKIPVLTLDAKWYRLLGEVGRANVKAQEEQLNELLRAQGRINSKIKEMKKLKKRLMNEIVELADESGQDNPKIAENKRLIEECNEKLDQSQEEVLDFPDQIRQVNLDLMEETMDHCYDTIKEYTQDIAEIEEWVTQIRIELKKKLIRKQEMEAKNHQIYSYMHDIFGSEVMDLFDFTYNPEDKHPTLDGKTKDKDC